MDAFVEKPQLDAAISMVADGSYFWNAGIFLFSAKDMMNAFATHAPEMIEHVEEAIANGFSDLDFFRLGEEPWNACKSISIDYAIMERVGNISAVPYFAGWSDLGSWDAIKEKSTPDEMGNVISNAATAIDCENVLLRAEHADQKVVGIGLKNINAIAMKDSVLIMDSEMSQDVGKIVEQLRDDNAAQADEFPWEHRPWGMFEVLSEQKGFKVKRIHVKPGGRLSLQKTQAPLGTLGCGCWNRQSDRWSTGFNGKRR